MLDLEILDLIRVSSKLSVVEKDGSHDKASQGCIGHGIHWHTLLLIGINVGTPQTSCILHGMYAP